ncbi:MAG: tetratricopeptide repeat protein, partial [Candidatus Sulfomarinibacteraceae bacterium]
MTSARRVLLIGWSAADWQLLQALLDEGALPNLASFLLRGAKGKLKTLQPQFEPLLWTSMATGQRADVHGVAHGLSKTRGLERPVDPVSGRDRHCRALWDMAAANGLGSAVINWPLTYPLPRVNGICVSDAWFALARNEEGGLQAPAPYACQPSALGEELAAVRMYPEALAAEEIGWFVADLEAAEAEQDPMLLSLAIALARTINTHAAAIEALAQDDWRLGMLRYDLLELLGPAFMACRAPRLPYISDAQFQRYQHTMTTACSYLDLLFGALLEHCDDDVTVLLVSERGLLSNNERPADAMTAFQQSGGVPWYREHGIFAAAGPGITPGGGVQGATLLDVTPTVLALLGVPLADDMPGRCLREMMPGVKLEEPVGSYDRGTQPAGAGAAWRAGERAAALRNALTQRWLPAAPGQTEQTEQAARDAQLDRDFNLAMVALDARRPNQALRYLQRLHEARPGDDRVSLHLARCLRATGEPAAARALLEQVVDFAEPRPYELMQLAQLHLADGEHDRALMLLFRAEQAEGQRPAVHSQIGLVYAALERWDEAERAFRKALERDAGHAPA